LKKHIWAVCYVLALTAFTAYISLDTFVLSRAYQTDATEINYSMFEQTEENSAPVQSDGQSSATEKAPAGKSGSGRHSHQSGSSGGSVPASTGITVSGSTYEDENISITMTEYYENNTKIYVADIRLSSAVYLKTAFADDTYGRNVTDTTSSIAADNDAVLAINGDYYGARERGYVIRNGIVYRDAPSSDDLLCIYANGTMKVISQSDYTADELVEQGVWQAFAFGPGLIEDGTITVSEGDEVGRAMASNPRTAIGIISENHYLFVVSDGRTSESEGLSLYELAQFMQSLGAETAYNLDGGGSSTMYYGGEVVNNPTTNGSIKERGVSDIVYIG
jgi:exopolysaccharide biosynthesis protein